MNEREAWTRLTSSPIAILATINPDGTPHMVPCTFASVSEHQLVSAVDSKPKATRNLQRLANIRRDARVTILAEHYEQDWDRLWWVRATGTAAIRQRVSPEFEAELTARYEAYADHDLGPWIVIDVGKIIGWAAHH